MNSATKYFSPHKPFYWNKNLHFLRIDSFQKLGRLFGQTIFTNFESKILLQCYFSSWIFDLNATERLIFVEVMRQNNENTLWCKPFDAYFVLFVKRLIIR